VRWPWPGRWDFLASLLPLERITPHGNAQVFAGSQALFGDFARALHRLTNRHVLITGERGVGKTTVVKEFARRAVGGEWAFLK
jgi:Cdc6-like AAA superfamily ATPase